MIRVGLTDRLKSAIPSIEGAANPLRTITMVGAHVHGGGNLSVYDRGYLHKIFSVCAKKSIAISPDVSVRVANLQYGHDFLTRPSGSDMVVFSYIYFDRMARAAQDAFGFTTQSRYARLGTNWRDALCESGAKVAVNIYAGRGETELPTRFLSRPPYSHAGVYPCEWSKLKFAFLMR